MSENESLVARLGMEIKDTARDYFTLPVRIFMWTLTGNFKENDERVCAAPHPQKRKQHAVHVR